MATISLLTFNISGEDRLQWPSKPSVANGTADMTLQQGANKLRHQSYAMIS